MVTVTKKHKLNSVNSRKLSSLSSESYKSKIKESEKLVLFESCPGESFTFVC